MGIPKKWPKRIFSAAVVSVVGFYAASGLVVIDDYTDRAYASEVLVATKNARAQITTALSQSPKVKISLDAHTLIPPAISTRSKEGQKIEIAYREISDGGTIKVFTPQLGVMLVLTPKVDGTQVTWSCWGSPNHKVPASCRGDS